MYDDDNEGPQVAEPTMAPVLSLFSGGASASESVPVDPDEPDLDDIVFIARRLVRNALGQVNWEDLAGGAQMMLDEGDLGVLRGILRQVEFDIITPDVEL